MTERLITPENLNKVAQAEKEINAFVNMLKDDSTTFDHIKNEYMELLKKYYPEVASTVIDIRPIRTNTTDVELNAGIITLIKREIGNSYRHHVANDICLSESAEIETESGYMENMYVQATGDSKNFHLTFTK